MEGDMKEIVLARLEQRLKDKDEEIHALKERVLQAESADQNTVKGLAERIDKLEVEMHEMQITLSEVMKHVGSLESTMQTLLMSMDAGDEEPSEVPTDMSMPGAPQMGNDFDNFAASLDQKDIKEDGHSKDDNGGQDVTSRFFHLSKNS